MTNNIRKFRRERELTQDQLAEMLKVRRATISDWEKGYHYPDAKNLKRLSEVFEVPITKICDILPREMQPLIINGKIPVYGQISAGYPEYAYENIEEYIWTSLDHPASLFALKVHGNSMNMACLPNGSYAIVRKQSMVDDGDIAVVLVGDEDATIKYFYHKSNFVTLKPCSNDPSYKDQIYNTIDTQIRIIGKVVAFQGEFHA